MIHYKGRLLSAICGLTLSLSLASSALAAPVVAPTTAGEQKPPAASEPVGVEKQSQTATEPAKIPQEDAIRIARETFSIPAEFGMPSVHYYSSERPSPVQTYYVNWSSPNHLASIRENFNVEIDASTGFVRSFNHYRYDPTNPGAMPKYRYDEAKMMAKEWLGKIQPSLIDQLRQDQALADEVQGRESLSYRWYRLVNGIPFPDDFIIISINPQDGSLQSYNCSWTKEIASFPSPAKAIAQADAESAFEQQLSANLVFQRFYQPVGDAEFRAVYQIDAKMIDAMTGDALDSDGQISKTPKPIQLPTSDQKLIARSTAMTKDEALVLARGVLGDLIAAEPDNASLVQEPASMVKKTGGRDELTSVWNLGWQFDGDGNAPFNYISVTVDAGYGVIRSFSLDGLWQGDDEIKAKAKTPVEETVARQSAINLLAKARPDLLGQVRLMDRSALWARPMGMPGDQPLQREYTFTFERMARYEGIPADVAVKGDDVNIVVDRFTGQVRNMWINWSLKGPELPSATLIGASEARALAKKELPLELMYRQIWSAEGNQLEPKLVYSSTSSLTPLFDGTNGHRLDWSGRDLTEIRHPIADIADNTYKNEIETMIYRQAFETSDGKFNPQGTINRGEAAKALVIALGQGDIAMKFAMETIRANQAPSYGDINYDSPFYCYIEQAVRSGILQPTKTDDQFSVDTLVSNEEFALWVVRAMGYGEIAKMRPAIEVSYSDQLSISAPHRNAVGILIGLEVLTGQGEFRPAAQMTRADAAHVLYIAAQKTPRNRIFY